MLPMAGGNRIDCHSAKASIYFSLKEKKALLGGTKINILEYRSEIPLAAGLLCYVKKENGYPADINDGILYPLDGDLSANESVTRTITTRKNEYLRLFIINESENSKYRLRLV
jgi:hypothetical protein